MRGSGNIGRGLALVLGGLMIVGGLGLIAIEGSEAAPAGAWSVVIGLVLIVAAILERLRYRSEAADLSGLPIGPGGGEPTGEPLEPRFQRTDEAFVDPTSGRQMRVWLDPQSGERRYRAEG